MTSLRAGMAYQARSRAAARNRFWWWAALLGMCCVLLSPLLVVDVPPLLDYPNHLARAFVLASLPGDAVLGRFYAPHWTIIPNLALDLIAPPLIHWLPVHVVGRLLIAIAVLLPVVGAVAYNTALGGRWWSLGVGLVAYNSCLIYGFLNFSISLGLALLLAAAWLRWREMRPYRAVTVAMVGELALFACHLMGLVCFALLIGSTELSRLYRYQGNGLPGAMLRRSGVLLLVFAAPLALYAVSQLGQLGGDAEYEALGPKLIQLITTFSSYDAGLDGLTACIVIGVLVTSLVTGNGRFPGPAAYAVGALAVVYFAAPNAWKGTYLLDTRIAIMLGFMMFAGFVPRGWPGSVGRPIAVTIVGLFLIRMTLLLVVWADHRADLADLRRVLQPVQPGQAVFVAEVGLHERPEYWRANERWRLLPNDIRLDEHLGALALIEHRAYWPFEFDIPSQQPIETLEPYRARAGRLGQMPIFRDMASVDVCGYDFVLLMEADAVPDLPGNRFRLLVKSGFAALYAITRCEGGA